MLLNYETRLSSFGVFGVPVVDLVLDALGTGTELGFLERQDHGERLGVRLGGIKDYKREAERVDEFSC